LADDFITLMTAEAFLKAVNSKDSQKYWTSIRYQQVRISKKEACRRVLSEKRFKLTSRRALAKKESRWRKRTASNQHTLPNHINISFFYAKHALTGKNVPPILQPIRRNALLIIINQLQSK